MSKQADFLGSFSLSLAFAGAALLVSACGGGAGAAAGGALPDGNVPMPGSTPGGINPSYSPPPGSNVHWIISETGAAAIETSMQPSQIAALFDNQRTYEILNNSNKTDPLPHAKHVLYYRDETLIAPDIALGKFASADGALYDDEAYQEPGNTTPQDQISNPLPYAQDAAKILHAAGKIFVYTIGPGVGPSTTFWTSTLPSVSPYPDVIDFQTQGAEGTPNFAVQVAHYSSVYRASGGHQMLVGISDSPTGKAESAGALQSAYLAALGNKPPVDGFWLNLAVKSNSCTGCPSTLNLLPVTQFLSWLGY